MYIDDILKQVKSLTDNNKSGSEKKTLTSLDFTPNNGSMIEAVREGAGRAYSVDANLAKKYNKYGLDWNPREYYNGSLDIQLADAQSNWTKFGNALAQTLVSEIGLGTLLGFSDLFDAIGQAVGWSDHNYQNPVSRKLEEWQEAFNNEVAPIYSRPGSGFENGTDFGWWMQNIPSIASSVTLLLPAAGTTKVLSMAGKAAVKGTRSAAKWARGANRIENLERANRGIHLSSKTVETGKLFAKNATTAALSRTMENYQEARQVYNDMYTDVAQRLTNMTDEEYQNFVDNNQESLEGIDTTNRDEAAKAIARKSADTTFKIDYANTVFDIIQLYALRNVAFHGFRNTKPSAAARRLDKNSRRFAGKYTTMGELEELVAKQSLKRKAADKVGDFLYTGRTIFAAEASEGVEEAVNYIAQQEGMNVGKTMLGMEANTAFSDRLHQYMKAPELWESAFWGLAGGIVFQGAGSGLNRVSTAIERKNEAKKKQANAQTGENPSANTSWTALWEQGDVKRVKTSIENRLAIENNYQQIVNQINNGENPFVPGEKVESQEEKELLINRAMENRRTAMVLNAMDSGTIGMLRGYLEDDNVKQALIDKGVVTKEEADRVQQEDIAAIDKIQEIYDKNVRTVNAASRNIRTKNGTIVPTEYLQIIARNNIEAQLAVQNYQAQLNSWENELVELENQFKDKLDPNINYKEIVKLHWLIKRLGELESEKRELKNNKEAFESLPGQERLRRIDNNIDNVRQMVSELNPENKVENLLYAIENSLAYQRKKDGNYDFLGTNKEYLKFREAATNKDYDYFKRLDKRLVDISEENLGAQQVLDENVRRIIDSSFSSSINNISSELGSAYAVIGALQYRIASERSNINETQKDIELEINHIHNYLNEVRKQKIKDATEQIKAFADQYGADNIRAYLHKRYNPNQGYDIENISEEDKELLNDAFDTLNLDDKINKNIAEYLDEILKNHEDIKAAQDAAREGEAGEFSSTSENAVSEPQNLEPNDIPQSPQNPISDKKTGQDGGITPETQPTQPQTPTPTNSGLNVKNIGDEKSVSSGMAAIVGVPSYTYHATENPDNFEVTFNTSDTENAKHLNNPDLFTQQEGVSLIDNNYIVAKNPVVDRQGNVVEKGYLALNNDENNEELAEREASIPLTGEEESSSSPVTSPERVAEIQQEETAAAQADIAQVPYDANDVTSRANDAVMNEIITARQKGSAIDWKDLQDRLTKALQQEGATSDYISKEIARAIEHGKKLADRKGIKSVDAVIETIVRSSAIREGLPKDAPARKEFTDAVVELLKVFNDEVGYETINGKKYINVEALCRYCDRVLDDKVSAKLLADNLVDYVKQNSDLIYTDGNINTVKERLETSLDGSNLRQQVIGIDYNTLLRDLTKTKSFKELEAFYDIIDNIQPGDNVQTVVGDKGIVFKVNNTTIGTLPFPKPYKNGGVYQYNDGWRTDILEHNGVIESDLRDLFIRWATDMNNSDIKELNDIITQYAYHKQNKADIATLVKAFENNKEVKQAIAKGFIVQNADTEKLLNGIAKIWQYTRANANDTQEEIADKRSADIAQWFEDKVAPSFKFIDYLRYNKNAVVEINSISEGSQIETPREQALPVSKAIGSKYKGKVRIGVVENTGVITVAGNGVDGATHLSFGGSRGNTFIIIPARNGNHAYIHAFPQSVNSNTLGQTAKRIKNNIYAEIERICHSSENPTIEQVQELEDFIKDLLSNYNGLFIYRSGAALYVRDNHFQDGGKNGFTVWHKEVGAEGKPQPLNINIKSDMKEVAAQLQTIFDECAAFNIHFGSVNSDRGGISSQRMTKRGVNGEFIISIPNQEEFTFASYNDFVIENDLVLATTKPTEDGKSNFERLTDNNETTQNITVKLGTETSSPVREINEDNQTPAIEATPEANIITSIFSNNRIKNKAVKVAETILGKNIVKQITFNGKKFTMFPKSVIFVDENLIDNATTNIGDKEVIHPNNKNVIIPVRTVVVGKEWLAMTTSENEAYRKEAVKKLIHEQLHLIIHDGNTQYIEQIREVFDEFAAKNTNEVLNKYLYKWDEARYYKDGKLTEEGLEEFLVESLTSNELAEGLNAIEAASDNNTDKKKSLFQKIMEVITKMLGIDIKKGSLYEKEFKLLRDVLSTPTQTEVNLEETITETEEVDLSLDDDDFDIYSSKLSETKGSPSVAAFVDTFPVQKQGEIREQIENGEINISCK